MTSWYRESFGEDYLLVYKHRSQTEADRQVDAILSLLDLKQDVHILDLCCGTGRHAISLAKRGFRVTGFDLSEVLLSYARRDSGHLPVNYVKGDMRTLPFSNESFHVVLNLFTSFGYFADDRENEKVLQEISRVLVPEGHFLIDFLNREYVRQHLNPLTEREENGVMIREERTISGDYVKKKITITEGVSERTYDERVKMYQANDMERMMESSGLKVERIFGDFDGTEYSTETPRMIFFGKRRP